MNELRCRRALQPFAVQLSPTDVSGRAFAAPFPRLFFRLRCCCYLHLWSNRRTSPYFHSHNFEFANTFTSLNQFRCWPRVDDKCFVFMIALKMVRDTMAGYEESPHRTESIKYEWRRVRPLAATYCSSSGFASSHNFISTAVSCGTHRQSCTHETEWDWMGEYKRFSMKPQDKKKTRLPHVSIMSNWTIIWLLGGVNATWPQLSSLHSRFHTHWKMCSLACTSKKSNGILEIFQFALAIYGFTSLFGHKLNRNRNRIYDWQI